MIVHLADYRAKTRDLPWRTGLPGAFTVLVLGAAFVYFILRPYP